ncbi:MAG: glycosyltransferase family 2 protein [Bacillota bacterium]
MAHWLDIVMIPLQIFIIFFTWYYFLVGFFGLWHKKERIFEAPVSRFALVVAAHNEEAVVGQLVENFYALNYPRELVDIYVVADNCNDKTAEIASNAGAKVFERFNKSKRGKGYALEWLLGKLFAINKKYDGVCVFDADNLVHPDFLKIMNNRLLRGEKIIQGFIDAKNPNDSWTAATFAMMFWVVNHVWHLAKYNMGLSCVLGGTGMCISYELLKKFGWGATCLVEDMEFTMKALAIGIPTTWAHEAIVYDEKPLTFKQSWIQRKRWVQGQFDVASRYVPILIKNGIKRRDIRIFEGITPLLQPLFLIFSTLFLIAQKITEYLYTDYGIAYKFTFILHQFLPVSIVNMFTTVQYVIMAYILIRMSIGWRTWVYLPLYPVFMLTWVPLAFVGFWHRNKREWAHTTHSRAVNYKEILKQKGINTDPDDQLNK